MGATAVIEAPDIKVAGVSDFFDTLDLSDAGYGLKGQLGSSDVKNTLHYDIWEITTDNISELTDLISVGRDDAEVPALTVGANFIMVRDEIFGSALKRFGIPLSDDVLLGNYVFCHRD